jgi:hypothetical protein
MSEGDVQMRAQTLIPAVLLVLAATPTMVVSQNKGAPEIFTANLHVTGAEAGAAAAAIQIQVQRYTPDADRTAVEAALKSGGYPAFVTALRKAPEVGTVSVGDQKWSIRWARERPTKTGRTIVLVTDKPVFFVGGGRVDAKPREGYEVAVIQMNVDDAGLGNGSMAAAAKVKPGGETGVTIEDYADNLIKLVTVVRKIQ